MTIYGDRGRLGTSATMKALYLGFECSLGSLSPSGRAVLVQSSSEADLVLASSPIGVVCIGPLAAGTEDGWLTAERSAADSIAVIVSGAGDSLPRYQPLVNAGQVLFLASAELSMNQLAVIVSTTLEALRPRKERLPRKVPVRRLPILLRDLLGSEDLEELERTLARWNEQFVPGSRARLWLVSPADHVLWSTSTPTARVLPVSSGLTGWVVATRRSALSEDLSLDPRRSAAAGEDDVVARPVLAIPVFDEARTVQAVLEILGSPGGPFPETGAEAGEFLAYLVGPVLRALRLNAEADAAFDPARLVRPEALEAWRHRFDLGVPLLRSQGKLLRALQGLVLVGLLGLLAVAVWVVST